MVIIRKSSGTWVDRHSKLKVQAVSNGHEIFHMDGVILNVWIPVAVSDVEIASHNYCGSDVSCIIS